jgi:hypothetical protein
MADAPSVTTVVMGDRLPWPDEPSAIADKGPFDAAVIYHGGERKDCVIRKISALGVTVGGELTPAVGDKVAVELATGQRAAGTVTWAERRELGVRFEEAIDMIALLNRKLISQTPERRTMPRLEVRCPVHVKSGEHFCPASLRNISARGLQIEGEELPAIGTYVSVFVEELIIPPGEVVWRREKLAGIEVFEELSWTSIIPWVRTVVRQGANSRVSPR